MECSNTQPASYATAAPSPRKASVEHQQVHLVEPGEQEGANNERALQVHATNNIHTEAIPSHRRRVLSCCAGKRKTPTTAPSPRKASARLDVSPVIKHVMSSFYHIVLENHTRSQVCKHQDCLITKPWPRRHGSKESSMRCRQPTESSNTLPTNHVTAAPSPWKASIEHQQVHLVETEK